jgi:hypothetical protein
MVVKLLLLLPHLPLQLLLLLHARHTLLEDRSDGIETSIFPLVLREERVRLHQLRHVVTAALLPFLEVLIVVVRLGDELRVGGREQLLLVLEFEQWICGVAPSEVGDVDGLEFGDGVGVDIHFVVGIEVV